VDLPRDKTMFAILTLLVIAIGYVQSQTELILPPLPYAYNALEPILSEKLMHLHHDKHFQTYTTKTNDALKAIVVDEKVPKELKDLAKQPIELILTHLQHLPEHYHLILRHNGGGYVNHKLFFSILKTPTATVAENQPTGALLEAIEKILVHLINSKKCLLMHQLIFLVLVGFGFILMLKQNNLFLILQLIKIIQLCSIKIMSFLWVLIFGNMLIIQSMKIVVMNMLMLFGVLSIGLLLVNFILKAQQTVLIFK